MINLSILTANYNNSRFLPSYFNSILSSTKHPFEIVFVDDGSTDNSIEIVTDYKRKTNLKINLISLNNNFGFNKALRIGLEHISTPFLMRLDPDDFILPSKIELQYNFLLNNKTYDVLGTNAYYYNEYKRKIIFKTNLPTSELSIQKHIKSGNIPILHSSIMGKTTIFQKFAYLRNDILVEDYSFLARLIKNRCRISNLHDYLMYYRIHNNNLSHKDLKNKIYKRFFIRDLSFNKKTFPLKKRFSYYNTLFYRKALLSTKKIKSIFWGFISFFFQPQSLLRRINNYFKSHLL